MKHWRIVVRLKQFSSRSMMCIHMGHVQTGTTAQPHSPHRAHLDGTGTSQLTEKRQYNPAGHRYQRVFLPV
jgi:hypothetical protein